MRKAIAMAVVIAVAAPVGAAFIFGVVQVWQDSGAVFTLLTFVGLPLAAVAFHWAIDEVSGPDKG